MNRVVTVEQWSCAAEMADGAIFVGVLLVAGSAPEPLLRATGDPDVSLLVGLGNRALYNMRYDTEAVTGLPDAEADGVSDLHPEGWAAAWRDDVAQLWVYASGVWTLAAISPTGAVAGNWPRIVVLGGEVYLTIETPEGYRLFQRRGALLAELEEEDWPDAFSERRELTGLLTRWREHWHGFASLPANNVLTCSALCATTGTGTPEREVWPVGVNSTGQQVALTAISNDQAGAILAFRQYRDDLDSSNTAAWDDHGRCVWNGYTPHLGYWTGSEWRRRFCAADIVHLSALQSGRVWGVARSPITSTDTGAAYVTDQRLVLWHYCVGTAGIEEAQVLAAGEGDSAATVGIAEAQVVASWPERQTPAVTEALVYAADLTSETVAVPIITEVVVLAETGGAGADNAIITAVEVLAAMPERAGATITEVLVYAEQGGLVGTGSGVRWIVRTADDGETAHHVMAVPGLPVEDWPETQLLVRTDDAGADKSDWGSYQTLRPGVTQELDVPGKTVRVAIIKADADPTFDTDVTLESSEE